MANQVISAIKGVARVIGETYKLGFRAWWAAPLIVAIVVVPEFIQHIVEIKLGMFQSMQQFQDLSQNPTRWLFGYVKVAGTVIGMLAIARFWAVGTVRKTFLIPPPDLARLVLAIVLTWAASLPFDWLATRHLPALVITAVRVISTLVQAGLAVFVAAALFGDRAVTLRTAFTDRWPTALVLALAVIVAFVPAQLLHMLDHKLAIGKPATVVWALMAWDALVVGLIATLTGSALWAAYHSGATWQGWAPGFMPEPAGDDAEPAAEPVAETAPPAPVVAPEPAPIVDPEPAAEPVKRTRPRPGPRPRR